jgi:hypothetical protein
MSLLKGTTLTYVWNRSYAAIMAYDRQENKRTRKKCSPPGFSRFAPYALDYLQITDKRIDAGLAGA